jgi:hypothetical protein
MNKFFEKYKWSQLIQEEKENLNSPVLSKETEFIIKLFPQAGCRCPAAILAIWEAVIRIEFWGQSGQKERSYLKNTHYNKKGLVEGFKW